MIETALNLSACLSDYERRRLVCSRQLRQRQKLCCAALMMRKSNLVCYEKKLAGKTQYRRPDPFFFFLTLFFLPLNSCYARPAIIIRALHHCF